MCPKPQKKDHEEIKRDMCPEPQKNKKNGQVPNSRIGDIALDLIKSILQMLKDPWYEQ